MPGAIPKQQHRVNHPWCSRQGRHHSLEVILLLATLAVIYGTDSWTEVEFFGHQKQVWLETFLALTHGVPLHDTFGRVFGLLGPAQLEVCLASWVQSLAVTLQDGIVAVAYHR